MVLSCLPGLSAAEEAVRVDDATGWSKASAGDARTFARQPGTETLDLSGKSGKGVGYVLKTTYSAEMDSEHQEQAVLQYTRSIEKAGHTEIKRKPAKLASLSGVCVTSSGHSFKGDLHQVTYLLFAKHEMYTISVLGPQGTSETSPLVSEYLARVKLPAALMATATEVRSAPLNETSNEVYWWVGAVAAAALACGAFFAWRLKRQRRTV